MTGCSSANYTARVFDQYHYWAGGLALNVW